MEDKAKCKNCTDKMIEEMAKVMAENWFNETIISTAERLINAGYRKIPEGSVVLSKEEYEGLQMAKDFNYGYHEGEKNMTLYYENIKLPEARKETAKEILKDVLEGIGEFYAGDIVEELAKKYGVEVEE